MLKKTLLAIIGLALSAPVFADYGYRAHHDYCRPYVRYYPVAPRPVLVAPAPVVVYRAPRPEVGAAIVAGALLGAVVAHQIVTR